MTHSEPADRVAVAVRRALRTRLATLKLRSEVVEKRIEREHAHALRALRKR